MPPLGGLIEAISGKSLQAVLHEELVDPLGLDGKALVAELEERHDRPPGDEVNASGS